MDISDINNSQIFTETFAKGIAKYSSPNHVSFNNPGAQHFNKILYNELDGINMTNAQKRKTRILNPVINNTKPLNKVRANYYPEAFFFK